MYLDCLLWIIWISIYSLFYILKLSWDPQVITLWPHEGSWPPVSNHWYCRNSMSLRTIASVCWLLISNKSISQTMYWSGPSEHIHYYLLRAMKRFCPFYPHWVLKDQMRALTFPPSNNPKAMETLVRYYSQLYLYFSIFSGFLSAECAGCEQIQLGLSFLRSTRLTLELGPVCALPCVILPNTFRDL